MCWSDPHKTALNFALNADLGDLLVPCARVCLEDGDRLFRNTCGICHSLQPDQNRLGPSLAGIIGRKAGTVAGFDYSEANKNSNVVWDEAELDQYLSNPKQFMPGTKMIYPGMKDAEQRKALIAYLRDPK